MKEVLDVGLCAYGAQVLLKHLEALAGESAGVASGHPDIEFIHRMRVASRRLRAAMPLFSNCLPQKKAVLWLKQIRNITRALGAARDADVQLELLRRYEQQLEDPHHKPGITRLLLRLAQVRKSAQPHLETALAELASRGTVEEMRAELVPLAALRPTDSPPTQALYSHAHVSILARLDDLLAYDEIVPQPDKVSELHQMRIAAKWLRYTMENFAALYAGNLKPWLSTNRGVQETLGNIHDCDVWSGYLPAFLEEERSRMLEYFGHSRTYYRLVPGIQAFLASRQAARQELYSGFVPKWQSWQEEGLWTALRRTIEAPLLRFDAIFPPPDEPRAGL